MSDEQQDRLAAIGEQLVSILKSMHPLEREKTMSIVSDVYCFHCWQETGGERCYCTRDE